MDSEHKKRKNSFNHNWIEKYSWLKNVESDDSKAFCKLCKSVFSIASKGESAVKDHANGLKHQNVEKSAASSKRFFTRKCKLNSFLIVCSITLCFVTVNDSICSSL